MRCAISASATTILLALAWLASGGAVAAEWTGELAAESRYFFHDTPDPRQQQWDLSLAGRVDFFHDWDNERQRFAAAVAGRADNADGERSKMDLREFYWRYRWPTVEVLVGVDRVFWGVTEALHLVDIINQTDLVENPSTEVKLGQPMLRFSWTPDWGTWDFFVLPGMRERPFPGSGGRLRGPVEIVADAAAFESQDGRSHTDYAVRYSHYIGPLEFALSHFNGTERTPAFTLLSPPTATSPARIAPFYFLTDQTALEMTFVAGEWLWKLEALSKRDAFRRYTAATGGFEYSLFGIAGSGIDVGIIVEYQYDERGGSNANAFDAASTFDDDLVAGLRFARNDFAGSELLVLLSRDLNNQGQVLSLEASRRLGNDWRVAIEGRAFSSDDPEDPLALFDREDYLQLSLTRFF